MLNLICLWWQWMSSLPVLISTYKLFYFILFFLYIYILSHCLWGCVQISFSSTVVLMCPQLPALTFSFSDSLSFSLLSYLSPWNILLFFSFSVGQLFKSNWSSQFWLLGFMTGHPLEEGGKTCWQTFELHVFTSQTLPIPQNLQQSSQKGLSPEPFGALFLLPLFTASSILCPVSHSPMPLAPALAVIPYSPFWDRKGIDITDG